MIHSASIKNNFTFSEVPCRKAGLLLVAISVQRLTGDGRGLVFDIQWLRF